MPPCIDELRRLEINCGDDHSKVVGGMLLNQKQFSDITFVFDDGCTYYGHKCILAANSSYFKQMFSESGVEMANKSSISVRDTSPEAFFGFLTLCYTGSFGTDHAILLVELHKLLETYIMPNVKDVVANVILKHAEDNAWEARQSPNRRTECSSRFWDITDASHRAGQTILFDALIEKACLHLPLVDTDTIEKLSDGLCKCFCDRINNEVQKAEVESLNSGACQRYHEVSILNQRFSSVVDARCLRSSRRAPLKRQRLTHLISRAEKSFKQPCKDFVVTGWRKIAGCT